MSHLKLVKLESINLNVIGSIGSIVGPIIVGVASIIWLSEFPITNFLLAVGTMIGGVAALLYFLEKAFLGESENSSTAASLIEQRYWQSLELNQALARRDGMAKDCADLGNFYKGQGNRQQAVEMYLKSIQIYQEIGDSHAQVVQQWLEKLQTNT